MKSSTIKWFIGLGCLLPIILAIVIPILIYFGISRSYGSGKPAAPVERIGILRETGGSATLERAGDKTDVTEEVLVQSGDRIRVEAGSAELVWNGYGRTALADGTDLVIDDVSRPEKGSSLRVRLRLHAGRLWTRLQRLLDVGSDFTVRSSDVVATVRGTSFGIERTERGVEVKVKESKVAIARFPVNAVMTDLNAMMENAPLVDAGSYMSLLDNAQLLPKPVLMNAEELNDPFMNAGDEELSSADYVLPVDDSAWLPWIMWGLGYVSQHPEVFESEQAFETFMQEFPADLQFEIETSVDEGEATSPLQEVLDQLPVEEPMIEPTATTTMDTSAEVIIN